MDDFDWNQMRGFLAAAESGSFSAAARKLKLTQPTLSRQVSALEEAMGVTLFERVGKSLQLTETGHDLLEHARAMGSAADLLSLSASGRSDSVEGLVSISVSDGFATFILPTIVRDMRAQEPGLRIEIVTSNTVSDLRRREADIAIRHVRPEEPDLIAKLIRDVKAGFFASQRWIQEYGHPRRADEIKDQPFIGYDRSGRTLEYFKALGIEITEANFAAISENSVSSWALAREGLGVCVMANEIAAAMPDMVPILEGVPPVEFPIWLVTHSELRTSRKIRFVFDYLAEALK